MIQVSGVDLYKYTDASLWRNPLLPLTLPNTERQQLTFTDVADFIHKGITFVFTFNTSRHKKRGRHTGIQKYETLLREERKIKGETRLLCHWVCGIQITPCDVYVGPVFHSSTPSVLNKTLLYEFTPICTIWTDYHLFWHVPHGNLCPIWMNASELQISADTLWF